MFHQVRSLPRVFLPWVDLDEPLELPRKEYEKFRKVLRLVNGDRIAVLPNDGSLIVGKLQGPHVVFVEKVFPDSEPKSKLTLVQALPKADKLDTIIRMCTEVGVSHFVLFPSDRSVLKWEGPKLEDRLGRYRSIAREAAEQSFRSLMPTVEFGHSLAGVLQIYPNSIVLSEVEGLSRQLKPPFVENPVLVIGPEGGWSPRELDLVGDKGVTLGPRVLRADTAGPIAAALVLLSYFEA